MATLANVSGASLVGDFGNILGQGFEAQNVRKRAADDQADLEAKIAAALGVGGPQAPQDAGAMARLGQLSPELAQTIGSAQPAQMEELRTQTQTGMDLATELQALPDHASRMRRLADEAGTAAAAGGDLSRLVALSNMDPSALDLELQKMQVIGRDAMTLMPQAPPSPNATFAALMADNPQIGQNLLGRRDQQVEAERQRQEQAARQAAAARANAASSASQQERQDLERMLAVGETLAGQSPEAFNAGMAQLGYADELASMGVTAENFTSWTPSVRAHLGIEVAPAEMVTINGQRVPANVEGDFRTPAGGAPSNAAIAELTWRAAQAGLVPGTTEYEQFILNAGGSPSTFRALDMQAQASGLASGTPEYQQFMATRGAGLAAEARTTGENIADIATGGEAAAAIKSGTIAQTVGLEAFQSLGKARTSLGNIEDAIAAIDAGGQSGLVYKMIPSVTESSAALENTMNKMGLDVIGSVSFGALSEGEMKLAMSTAVPRDLAPAELRSWLVSKKDAQVKAIDALSQATQYLSSPGNTLTGWVQGQAARTPPPEPARAAIPTEAEGVVSQAISGQAAGGYSAMDISALARLDPEAMSAQERALYRARLEQLVGEQ